MAFVSWRNETFLIKWQRQGRDTGQGGGHLSDGLPWPMRRHYNKPLWVAFNDQLALHLLRAEWEEAEGGCGAVGVLMVIVVVAAVVAAVARHQLQNVVSQIICHVGAKFLWFYYERGWVCVRERETLSLQD